jgi:exo-poly-alpha-galacturonosidase
MCAVLGDERFRRRIAVVATAAVLGVLTVSGLPAQADPGSPTCVPHDIHEPSSSVAPQHLCVPAAATDATSTLLVWRKSDLDHDVVDYVVYQDGDPIGTAEENARTHGAAQEYIDAARAADEDGFHVRTVAHSFTVVGLAPASRHTFTVRALHSDGTLSVASEPVTVSTADVPRRVAVTDPAFGAVGDGQTLNTAAIQKAIDTCRSEGCTVVVPAGTFRTGALFLHGDMTLQLDEGAVLQGSDRWQDYPLSKGYYLYPVPDPLPAEGSYTTYLRPPSLINVLPGDNGRREGSREPGKVARNVRIVGQGSIDGNGWKTTDPAEIIDEAGRPLPQYRASNAGKVVDDGILAADQFRHAKEHPEDLFGAVNPPTPVPDSALYGNYRSSLITVMGVENFYVGGPTLLNPAYHGLMFLDSDNVTVDDTRFLTFDTNNGDGVEFGGADNGIVTNSLFDTGDDAINFAAGQGRYGEQGRPSQNVWIFDNYVRRGHGGVAVGSHTAAWVQNVLAEDNVFHRTETGALRMKSTSDMGGGGSHFLFRDSAVTCMKTSAFIASLSYSLSASGYLAADSATFTDVTVSNVSVDGNSTTTCGPAASTRYPVIDVAAGPGVSPETAPVGPFLFDDVRLRNVNATDLRGLTGSTFRDVCFASVHGNGNPWRLDEYSTGNTFVGVTPMPGEPFAAGSCGP